MISQRQKELMAQLLELQENLEEGKPSREKGNTGQVTCYYNINE